jgi:hypothetical protein
MDISVIGDRGYGQRSHFSENIALEFSKIGHKTDFLACEDIQSIVSSNTWNLYRYKGKKVKLSKYLNQDYDFIFIDQCDLECNVKDLKIPVIYNHKYLHRSFGVKYPTIAMFLTKPLLEWFSKVKARKACYKTKYKYVMPSCTELDTYQPKEKIYKGVNYFGSRNETEDKIDHLELMSIAQRSLYRRDEKKLRRLGINIFETPIPTLKYRELLPRCEAMFMIIPKGQFVSRMMFEAMACKTLFICEIQSDRHENILKSLGFNNREHYIGIDKISEIEQAFIETTNKEEIIENAYNVVINYHTYRNRANYILSKYRELIEST